MKKSVKNVFISLSLVLACGIFTACESTSQESAPKTQSSAKTSKAEDLDKNDAKSETASQFKKEVQNMKIELVSASDTPVAGAAFAKPYTVSVKDNDSNPYANYTLSVTYPKAREENAVIFETTEITTNDAGIATFKPETITTSINSTVTFAPKAPNASPSTAKLVNSVALEVPCRVRFALGKKCVMIDLIDYSESGKMILDSALSTSSATLQEFWKAGYPYQAQNADFHKVIDQGTEAIHKAAQRLVQGSTYFKYIIYGKVQYVSPITETENGYTVTLKATANVIDYTTGKEYYATEKTCTVTSKNKWEVLKACQAKIAKELTYDLIYAM
ncbi:MAG: hypothetical protein KBS84_07835 [Treponema sp.]|nr:hypothetical protein [Candidatus Treponema scatequi]